MSKAAWYAALWKGDCLELERLLDSIHGHVLVRTYPDEAEAQTVGWNWKGCNVLHVAVKQGSEALVTKILGFFNDGETPPVLEENQPRTPHVSSTDGKLPSEILKDLILAFDGNCRLDAVAIAVLNGNERILRTLAVALVRKCRSNPYKIPEALGPPPPILRGRSLDRIREITASVLRELGQSHHAVTALFQRSHEFSFLPMEVFLFHALCACSERNTESELLHMVRNCKQKLLLKVFQLGRADEVQRLFDLEDGRGRTPLHVAVDHDAIKEFFSLKEYFQEAFWRHIVNRRDAGGRTPLHRTASSIEPPKDLTLLVKDEQTDKALTFEGKDLKFIVDVTKVSVSNGFSKATFEGALASHIACYNPRGAKIMKIMKKFRRAESRSSNTYKRRTGTTDQILTPLELAASVGNTSIVRLFEMQAWEPLEEDSLCIAAATGNSQALEHIISTQQFRNSKAMYAAIGSDEKVEKKIASTGKSLLDVVNFRDGWCKMEEKWQILSDNKARADRRERQACVNLLLQAGLSTHPDVLGRYPTPGPSCSAEFCSWWSERTEREVQDTRMSLTTATNAISVTAALVATTAFIGPLQPPKGYNENYAQIHTANVRIYLFCDTLAFYLALSAIVLAMIPSLPMCSEWVKIHERRTRKTVVYAVLLLICSVFYILVAFACASVAIIPKDHFWGHAILTLSTATLGAGVFYLTMRAFYKRLKDLFLDLISPDGNQSETKLSHLIKSQYDYLKEYSSSR